MVDGHAWTLWQTLPAGSPSAVFTGQSGHSYAFRSIARDVAGNVESKAVRIEAGTYVPDLTAPTTAVTSVNDDTATFTVNFEGTDSGGSHLRFFDVYVRIDGGSPEQIGDQKAWLFNGNSDWRSGSVVYQATADGLPHTYRFYTIGTDWAGNVEAAPAIPMQMSW